MCVSAPRRVAAHCTEAHKEAWISRAESMVAQCLGHPGVLAFMMDQWAEMLEQQCAEAAQEQAAGGPASITKLTTSKPLLNWLADKVQVGLMQLALFGQLPDRVHCTLRLVLCSRGAPFCMVDFTFLACVLGS